MQPCDPERWGFEIKAFQKPYEPVLIWFIDPELATLNMMDQFKEVLDASKVLGDLVWIEGGILIIIWATAALDELTNLFESIALFGVIPIRTLAN
jgi:hypothetical protein